MSEQLDSHATGIALTTIDPVPLPTSLSAGGLLRQAREAAGLHIGALAVSLKVPVKKLEALEADRYDLLLDTVFVRALASSVCRTLKMDSSSVLRLLPLINSPKLPHDGIGTNASFRAPGGGQSATWTQMSRPAVLAGLVLILGTLVLVSFPAAKSGWNEMTSALSPNAAGPGAARPSASTAIAGGVGADAGTPAEEDKVSRLSSVANAARPEVSPLTSQLPAAMPASDTNSLINPLAAASAVLAPLAAAVTPAGDILVFSAKGSSWVEVTDSKGQVVLRRTLSAGETVGASGALPLVAVVGRADSTQVQVRGRAFDLSGYAKDNVARFEVR